MQEKMINFSVILYMLDIKILEDKIVIFNLKILDLKSFGGRIFHVG